MILHDIDDGFDVENRHAGTWMFEEYPTYAEWIGQFDFSKPANMIQLMPAHYGHLPVWCEGNVYLNGASASRHEEHGLVNTTDPAVVELQQKDGKPVLVTNVYDLLGDFASRMIHSDLLGKAFEPEQRFENPDGTAITFDADYFGTHRGTKVLPGPFAQAAGEYSL